MEYGYEVKVDRKMFRKTGEMHLATAICASAVVKTFPEPSGKHKFKLALVSCRSLQKKNHFSTYTLPAVVDLIITTRNTRIVCLNAFVFQTIRYLC